MKNNLVVLPAPKTLVPRGPGGVRAAELRLGPGSASRLVRSVAKPDGEEPEDADLVLLDADPLEDIHNTRLVGLMVKHGHLYDSADFETLAFGTIAGCNQTAGTQSSTRKKDLSTFKPHPFALTKG